MGLETNKTRFMSSCCWLSSIFILWKEPFQSQVFLFGTSCYFPKTAHADYFLNYDLIIKNCLKQIKWYIIYSPEKFRAKLILLRYESLVENMLILCSKTESHVTETSLLHLTLNLQLCKITAHSSHLNWGTM